MTDNEITKEHLEERVSDWKSRIASLYQTIEVWLSDMEGYTIEKKDSMNMHEELMQKYSIPPEKIKVLDILHNKKHVASIKPIGLWVIGANGRLDIISKNGSIILVDEAEKFSLPKWVVYLPKNKVDGTPFNQKFLKSILEL